MGLVASGMMRGKLNHRTLHYLGFSPAVLFPQHLKCPGFKRPPAEDNKEAGSRAETQGMDELLKLPWRLLAGGIVSLPSSFALLSALLRPEHAGQPAGDAAGRALHRHGPQSQAAHVVSAVLAGGSSLLGNWSCLGSSPIAAGATSWGQDARPLRPLLDRVKNVEAGRKKSSK